MPVSKQARAAQERQKDRLALEHARRRQAQRRRRITYSIVGVLAIGALAVVFYYATKGNGDSAKAAGSSGPKCIKRVDPLPKGAPDVPVQVGAPPTELIKKDLKVGTGATVNPGDTVKVNYIGVTCTTGHIFDSSYKTGKPVPIEFPLANVIKGWTNGMPGMKVGGQRLLGIPADQAYGDQANDQNGIPANEPLWFVVDLVSTKKTPPTTTVAPTTAPVPTTSAAG